MAIIQKLMDGVIDTLKTIWPKLNANFENINNELAEHKDLLDAIQTGDSGAAANAARLNSITGIAHPTLKDRLDIEYGEVTTELAEKTNKSSLPINVKDFGATGDGVTDDTAAIQATIDAAYAAGGGIVFFPPGTWIWDRLNNYKA